MESTFCSDEKILTLVCIAHQLKSFKILRVNFTMVSSTPWSPNFFNSTSFPSKYHVIRSSCFTYMFKITSNHAKMTLKSPSDGCELVLQIVSILILVLIHAGPCNFFFLKMSGMFRNLKVKSSLKQLRLLITCFLNVLMSCFCVLP